MPSLHIRGAAGADLHLAAGWTGVVGATRADELAFLRLVAGEASPRAGVVVREPDDAIVVRCRARVDAVAAALVGAPAVLVVDGDDRPDPEARAALVAALRFHHGVGLIATRDRALLDELTTATVRVTAAGARLYPGGYVTAQAAWQAEGETRGRERAARAAGTTRQQARLAEQAHQAARDAERSRAASLAARTSGARWKGPTSSRGK